MKRIIFVAIVIVAVIAGAACSKDKVKPSGNIVKYPVDIPEFNSIVIE